MKELIKIILKEKIRRFNVKVKRITNKISEIITDILYYNKVERFLEDHGLRETSKVDDAIIDFNEKKVYEKKINEEIDYIQGLSVFKNKQVYEIKFTVNVDLDIADTILVSEKEQGVKKLIKIMLEEISGIEFFFLVVQKDNYFFDIYDYERISLYNMTKRLKIKVKAIIVLNLFIKYYEKDFSFFLKKNLLNVERLGLSVSEVAVEKKNKKKTKVIFKQENSNNYYLYFNDKNDKIFSDSVAFINKIFGFVFERNPYIDYSKDIDVNENMLLDKKYFIRYIIKLYCIKCEINKIDNVDENIKKIKDWFQENYSVQWFICIDHWGSNFFDVDEIEKLLKNKNE